MYKLTLLYTIILISCTTNCFAQTNLEQLSNHYQQFDSIAPQEKIYAHTDRSLYKPNQTIWLKAYLVDSKNQASTLSKSIYAELIDPKGATVATRFFPNNKGTAKGEFQLANTVSGGIYKLRVYSTWMKNFDANNYFEKELTVQKVVLPNLLMKLDYTKESYGAGSEVIATLNLRDKGNTTLKNTTFNYTAKVDNKAIHSSTAQTDQNGEATILFQLPNKLTSNDGLLNVQIEHQGQTESISRSIPITLNNIDIQFLPEGGQAVAGTNNRIAFKALNEFGKPADILGVILDAEGKQQGSFESYHQGMGSFDLTMLAAQEYKVKITSPKGIDQLYTLPKALPNAIGLQLQKQTKAALTVNIYSPKDQELYIIAQLNGQVAFSKAITAQEGTNTISLPSQDWAIGIAQITIFDQSQQPQAERLVFVNKHRQINVEISPNKENYLPREEVKLAITATDELGKPVQGDFSLAVLDDNNWTFADDKQDNILSYLLMSSDLKGEVYEPNFYFDADEPKADTALDYVMLTHGWRRYNWEDLNNIQNWKPKYTDDQHIIDGIAVWNDAELIKNTKIYLSKSPNKTNKKNRLAQTTTNSKGLFSFQDIDCELPVYINLRSRGYRSSQKVCEYTANSYQQDMQNGTYRSTAPCYDNSNNNSYRQNTPPVNNYNDYQYDSRRSRSSGGNSRIQSINYTAVFNNGKSSIAGQLFAGDNEPLLFADVYIKKDGIFVTGCTSDYEGNYSIPNLAPGNYTIKYSYIGFSSFEKIIILKANEKVNINIVLEEEGVMLATVTVASNKPRLLANRSLSAATSSNKPSSTISASDIQRMATRNISSIAATTAGINQIDEGEALSSNGRRRNNDVFVDGNRVTGNMSIPESTVDATEVFASGTSARFENDRTQSSMLYSSTTISRVEADINFGGQTLSGRDISRMTTGYSGDAGNRYNSNSYWESNNSRQIQVQQLGAYPSQYSQVKDFYAPKYQQNKRVAVRNDFRETIYWNPAVSTNEKGKASVSFYNSDATTTFRAVIEGSNRKGSLAYAEQTYAVQLPFSMDMKAPAVLSYGDTVNFPLLLKNTSKEPLVGHLSFKLPKALKLISPIDSLFSIDPNSSKIIYIPTQVLHQKGHYFIYLNCITNNHRDQMVKAIEVAPKGFPTLASVSGQQIQLDTFIDINDPVDGSIQGTFNAYPSILDGLLDGVEGILQQPSGCFEQVSSSNYPNILALQLMENTGTIAPIIRKRALEYLNIGYDKIAGYETAQGGFEWYGRTPPHEGLTAYGLLQLHDMKNIYNGVSPKLITRVQKWLISRKDGKGGFQQNAGKYGFSGSKPAVFNAYIVWALASVGEKNIEAELALATKEALQSEDWYRTALAALAQFEYGNQQTGEELLTTLLPIVKKQGLKNIKTETTLTYSSGNASNIETLSFIALAILKSKNPDVALLNEIVEYLLSFRSYGRFGSTQSTIMAMKALVEYTQFSQQKASDGQIELYINKKLVHRQKYSQDALRKITLDSLAQYLKAGKNNIAIKFVDTKEALPYTLDIGWSSHTPASSEHCKVDLSTQLDSKTTKVGNTVRLQALLTNKTTDPLPSTMAVIGIPPGLSLQPWQLKELLDKKVVDFYEIKQNYLCLYYSELEESASRTINLDLKVDVPGVYQAPASTAYLYYTDEYKKWISGEKITIN